MNKRVPQSRMPARLIRTLRDNGGSCPSKFQLAILCQADPKDTRLHIDRLVASGVLRITPGKKGAHIITLSQTRVTIRNRNA